MTSFDDNDWLRYFPRPEDGLGRSAHLQKKKKVRSTEYSVDLTSFDTEVPRSQRSDIHSWKDSIIRYKRGPPQAPPRKAAGGKTTSKIRIVNE